MFSTCRSQLKKAMEISPRGQRAQELLKVTAGSQSISPFYWAIDSGALTCAEAILQDLLTIRADRDVSRRALHLKATEIRIKPHETMYINKTV